MDHLDEISAEELQRALDNVAEKKPTERLLAAIAYKNGVTQTELAEWYDVQRRTIYSWLNRLDTDEPLEQAVSDDKRRSCLVNRIVPPRMSEQPRFGCLRFDVTEAVRK